MKHLLQNCHLRLLLLRQDRALFSAAKALARALPGRVYIVGGFVRDLFLGIPSEDIDVEVYDMTAKALRSSLQHLFGDHVILAGESFQTWKVRLGENRDMDISLPRKESKTGRGHKGFQVIGDGSLDICRASQRRDFTMNAMLLDPLRYRLFDPFDGKKDLQKRTLRIVDEKHFSEDPLRVYRAVQFVARFQLHVPERTRKRLKRIVQSEELASLSKERVTEEMKKLLLKSERPSIGFELMRNIGLVTQSYPELASLIDVPQEPEWHPEGDVWTHTLMVLDEAVKIIRRDQVSLFEADMLAIVLGALCHDFGKATTTKLGEKAGVPRIRSLGHSRAGLPLVQSFLSRFSFGARIEKAVLASTLEHLKPWQLFHSLHTGDMTREKYDNAIRKMLKRHVGVSYLILLAVAEADFHGRALPEAQTPYDADDAFIASVLRQDLAKDPIKPLLRGRDLIALGMKPGARMGEIIVAIEDARDLGKIKTREEALALAKTLIR